MSSWPLNVLVGLALWSATGSYAQSVVRRDSGAVRVIEIAGANLAALPTWRLEGPKVRIEPEMGGLEYELNNAGSPWRLTDGRIVLANNQVELRFFDSTGRYLGTVARRGRGPGEYQQLLRLVRVQGDTLLALDARGSRIDVRDPNGKFVRAFKIPRTFKFAGLGSPAAVFEEYRYPDLRRLGLQQDTAVVRQLYTDGTAGHVVARLPGSWSEVLPLRSDIVWRGLMLAGGNGSAVYVQGDEFTTYWFGYGGRLVAITRVLLPRVPVTAADRRDEERRQARLLANHRVRVNPGVPPPVYATYLPQATRVLVDSEGRAWLRRRARYGAPEAEWIVLAPFGAPIARITMPAALQPNDIGVDYVLGILPDDDGVQSVYSYAIVR